MAEAEIENPDKSLVQRLVPRRKRWRVTLSAILFILIGLAFMWTQREDIADNIIADQLEAMGLPAEYEIDRIGGTRQVLSDLVIGDPEAPDLTIEKATVILRYRLGTPAIGRVEIEGARLFGSYREGRLSFGSLDPVVFAESEEPPALPDLDLKLVDGRALIETEFGPIGIKAEGEGELDDDFRGVLAATAPQLAMDSCRAVNASMFGDITTGSGKLGFDGPVRLASLRCPALDLVVRDAAMALDATTDIAFERIDAGGELSTAAQRYAGNSARSLGGTINASWSDEALNSSFALTGRGVTIPQAQISRLAATGSYRARESFARSELEADIEGEGVRLGDQVDLALANGIAAGEGNLLKPILERMRSALRREERGSSLAAILTVRQTGAVTNVVIPSANVRGGSGASLLSLSRVQLSTAGSGAPRFSGNVQTGGEDLPRIAGRMERRPGGDAIFRLRMMEYAAGTSRLAIPELVVAQSPGGAVGFSGKVVASGALPGGSARNLRLPVSGNWTGDGALSLWRRCINVAFDYLALANLEIENRSVTVCPGPRGTIVRSDGKGLRIAAGTPALDLEGRFAGTAIRVASGPIGLAYPGVMTARDLDISLGPVGTASNFRITGLDARLGGDELAGSFEDADILLDAVPLDVREARGQWRYADDVLTLAQGTLRVEDREPEDRFEPLIARDAELTLVDNVIRAIATLREPQSDRAVTDISMTHNLTTSRGHADLMVDDLVFDDDLQPAPESSVCLSPTGQASRPTGGTGGLSCLAFGVIANARGKVSGTGRIDWNANEVTSSGEFSTDGLDFAAAFGPVRGAKGTVRFTDLLNLTTAPSQMLSVAAVNPGIEVLDGEIEFSVRDGQFLSVAGGTWPFMGGQLILEAVDFNFGVSGERRYVFRIAGLEAAQFVEQMELGNLSATGTFDGRIPIVFDAQGNGRIEGGELDSRLPGGNVSYVGELTYEDLNVIANFAFNALRSLDYETMTIRMDGPLTGQIVTRVRFDGVSQGKGTSQNFITRQIANLPLRFNVNIRAPFYQLITSFKAMYDPAFVRDPRDLGLLSDDGVRLQQSVTGEDAAPDLDPQDVIPDEPAGEPVIQTQESESMP